VKVNVVLTVATLRIGLMIGLGLGLVLNVAVSDLRSGDSKETFTVVNIHV